MLSINRKKQIRSLARKKIRQEERLFIAEGEKLVMEILDHSSSDTAKYRIHYIVATAGWLEQNGDSLPGEHELVEASQAELKQVSLQQAPNQALAIVRMPSPEEMIPPGPGGISLGLSQLRDPGNMGTVLRVADWFGISCIYCSPDSVDMYNPKVIQASMGSFLRVPLQYRDLTDLIGELKVDKKNAVIAAGMKGDSVFSAELSAPCIIILGNESRGLPADLASLTDYELNIPYHDRASHAESLNVGVAAAVFCAEFRRRGL